MNRYKSCLFAFLCSATSSAVIAGGLDPLEQFSYQTNRIDQTVLLSVAEKDQVIFMAGERGVVFRSVQGSPWQQDNVPVSATFTRIRTLNNGLLGLAHSGAVLRLADTTERDWTVLLNGRDIPGIYHQFIASEQLSDSDRQMLEQEVAGFEQQGPDKPFLDAIELADGRVQLFGAYGLAFEMTSSEEGVAFQPISHRFENNPYMHFYSAVAYGGSIYVVGEQGTIYRSDDEGLHYTRIGSPYDGTFFGASEIEGDLYIYGMKGNLFRRTSSESWTPVAVDSEASITDMTVVKGEIYLLTQSGEIYTGCEYSCVLESRVSSPASSFVFAGGQLHLSTFSGPKSVLPRGDVE